MKLFVSVFFAVLLSTFAGGTSAQSLSDFGFGTLNSGSARPLVVVLINSPEVTAPNISAASQNALTDLFFGRSAAAPKQFFRANSRGKFTVAPLGIFGPYSSQAGNCDSQPGSTSKAGRRILRANAMQSLLSDPNFDAGKLDTDRDGILSESEVMVYIIYSCPPNTGTATSGEVRPVDVTANGMRYKGKVASSKPTVLAPTALHELAHLLGTIDLYGQYMACNCDQVSLMHVDHRILSNLDGPHKFLSGWTSPKVIDIADMQTWIVRPGEDLLLHDHTRRPREFFYVEYRTKVGTDQGLPNTGYAIWRVKLSPDKTLDRIQLVTQDTVDFMLTRNVQANGKLFDEKFPAFSPLWFDRTRANVTLEVVPTEENLPPSLKLKGRDVIDAAVSLPEQNRSYFLYRDYYKRYNHEERKQDRIRRMGYGGRSWSEEVQFSDAAINRDDQKIYFFRDGDYFRFSIAKDRIDVRRSISDVWQGVPDSLDAAVMHPRNGKVYFFKGDQYFRYDFTRSQVDKVGKINVDGWSGVPNKLDAALVHKNGKAYFFRGRNYYRYNFDQRKVDKIGIIGLDGWAGIDKWN